MPRLFAARVFRALLAVWFVLSVGEPSVVHVCPMHASAAAELADAGVGDMAMANGAVAMAHQARHVGHGSSSHSHSGGQHSHHCTCISCCVGCTSFAVTSSTPHLETPTLVAAVTKPASRSDVLALEAPPHLLPPSTGPPRA